jgi:hypothetical protein
MNDTEILEQVREMILNLAARSEPVFTRPLAEIIAYISEHSGPARSMKRELAQRAWDAEKVIREIVRDELHTAQITSKVAKLIFELSVPDQMKIELLENDVQLEVRDRDDKLLYVITTFDIKEAKDGDGCSGGCNCRT